MFYYILSSTYQKIGDLFCSVHFSGFSNSVLQWCLQMESRKTKRFTSFNCSLNASLDSFFNWFENRCEFQARQIRNSQIRVGQLFLNHRGRNWGFLRSRRRGRFWLLLLLWHYFLFFFTLSVTVTIGQVENWKPFFHLYIYVLSFHSMKKIIFCTIYREMVFRQVTALSRAIQYTTADYIEIRPQWRRLNSAASVTMALLSLLQEGSLQHAFVGTLSTSSLSTHSRYTMNENSGNSVWFSFYLYSQQIVVVCLI